MRTQKSARQTPKKIEDSQAVEKPMEQIKSSRDSPVIEVAEESMSMASVLYEFSSLVDEIPPNAIDKKH